MQKYTHEIFSHALSRLDRPYERFSDAFLISSRALPPLVFHQDALYDGHHDDGHPARAESVVVQVQPPVHLGGAHDDGRVEHAGQDSGHYAEAARNGRQPHRKDRGQLHAWRGERKAVQEGGQEHAGKHRQIVAHMGPEGGEAESRQDSAHHRPGEVAPYQTDVGGAERPHKGHVHQRVPLALHEDEIRHRPARMLPHFPYALPFPPA